jgi:hypothetical protein
MFEQESRQRTAMAIRSVFQGQQGGAPLALAALAAIVVATAPVMLFPRPAPSAALDRMHVAVLPS